jgi:hypothetical protein
MLAATLYQKLSRFPTRHARADAEGTLLHVSMMGGRNRQLCAAVREVANTWRRSSRLHVDRTRIAQESFSFGRWVLLLADDIVVKNIVSTT